MLVNNKTVLIFLILLLNSTLALCQDQDVCYVTNEYGWYQLHLQDEFNKVKADTVLAICRKKSMEICWKDNGKYYYRDVFVKNTKTSSSVVSTSRIKKKYKEKMRYFFEKKLYKLPSRATPPPTQYIIDDGDPPTIVVCRLGDTCWKYVFDGIAHDDIIANWTFGDYIPF